MALSTPALVPDGLLHAVSEGTIDVGPGFGQVPAFGANQLMQLDLTQAFSRDVRNKVGYAEQVYIIAKAFDTNVTAIRLDATQFVPDANGDPGILRLRVDLTAAGQVYVLIEAHHSAGR